LEGDPSTSKTSQLGLCGSKVKCGETSGSVPDCFELPINIRSFYIKQLWRH
jgi:hypothetical protein